MTSISRMILQISHTTLFWPERKLMPFWRKIISLPRLTYVPPFSELWQKSYPLKMSVRISVFCSVFQKHAPLTHSWTAYPVARINCSNGPKFWMFGQIFIQLLQFDLCVSERKKVEKCIMKLKHAFAVS